MNQNKNFLWAATMGAFITVITTIGIHALFDFSGDFNERLLLYKDPEYIFSKWWIIIHCLMVMFSMAGVFLVIGKNGFALIGFVGYCVFAVTEISRQMMVLFHLNGLRRAYLETSDEIVQKSIEWSMQHIGYTGLTMFGVFIFFFALGNLNYGIALWRHKGFTKLISVLLIVWGIKTLVILGSELSGNTSLNSAIGIFNSAFQPVMRALIGIWLLRVLMNKPVGLIENTD